MDYNIFQEISITNIYHFPNAGREGGGFVVGNKRKKSAERQPVGRPEAVCYLRVSSAEQAEGFSIAAQQQAASAYAAAQGFKVVAEFADVETAKRAGRRQFDEMCRFLKKSRTCQVIICEKTDRLYRNLKDWVALDDLMTDADLAIHLYREGTLLNREARSHEKFIHGIKVLMAKNYVDNLSEEVRKGLNEKARQGHYPLRAPIGYVNNPVTRRIDLDPTKAPAIKRIFDLYASGGYSLEDLAAVAKEEKLTSWSPNSTGAVARTAIHRILTNPIYHGTFVWKGQPIQGQHVPIVSKSTFDAVQAILVGRSGGIYQDRSFAFTGVMTCGHCGCAITAELKKGKYIYYHCTGNKGECKRRYVREEKIADQLGQTLQALTLDERLAETLRVGLRESLADEVEYHKRMVTTLKGQEERLLGRLRQLYMDKLDGNVGPDLYDELKAKWDTELTEARSKLAAHAEADRKYLEFGLRLFELAQTAYSSYIQRSASEKRELLNYVLSNCVLKDGKVVPTYREPFALIASAPSMMQKRSETDPSDPTRCLVKWR